MPAKRVRQRAGDGDGGVGEAGRRGEPVGAADPGADGERDGGGATGADQPWMTSSSPTVATTSASQSAPDERVLVERSMAGSSNIRLARTAPTQPPTTWAAM